MKIGNKTFKDYTYVMAILNATPDSFYKGSRVSCDQILFRVENAIKEGAAVIDLGAQSTRPGYKEVSPEVEISRLEKLVYEIKRNFSVPLSIDTYSAECARAVLGLGADMINDVRGCNVEMASAVAAHNASLCIMHYAEKPLEGDIFPQITGYLKGCVQTALNGGVDADKICVDGGIGFAKSAEQSAELLHSYEKLAVLGYPLLLGASRKSFLGGKVENRLPATLETTRLAARKRVLFVRVHDVKENCRTISEEYEQN